MPTNRNVSKASQNVNQPELKFEFAVGYTQFDNQPSPHFVKNFRGMFDFLNERRNVEKHDWYFCGPLTGNRKAVNTKDRLFLSVDIDGGAPIDFNKFRKQILERYSCFWWATASHTKTDPHIRVVLELAQPVDRATAIQAGVALMAEWSDDFPSLKFDKSAFRSEQPQFFAPVSRLLVPNFSRERLNAVLWAGCVPVRSRGDADGGGDDVGTVDAGEALEALRVIGTDPARWAWVGPSGAGDDGTIDAELIRVMGACRNAGVATDSFLQWAEQLEYVKRAVVDPERRYTGFKPIGDAGTVGAGSLFWMANQIDARWRDRWRQAQAGDATEVFKSSGNSPMVPYPGAMTDLANAIHASAHRPDWGMAIMGALIGMAACCSGRVMLWDERTRFNLYATMLANSGGGKDHIFNCAGQIARTGGADVIGKSASGAGLEDSLTDYKNVFMVIDEISHHYKIAGSTSAAGYQTDFMVKYLELFGAGSREHFKRGKADRGAIHVSAEERTVRHPCLSVLSFAVTGEFAKVVTEKLIADGTLNRNLYYISRESPALRDTHRKFIVPESVAGILDHIKTNAGLENEPVIQSSEAAKQALVEVLEEFNDMSRNGGTFEPLTQRLYEQTKKIAGVVAYFDNPGEPVMTADHVQWATEFVKKSYKQLTDFVSNEVANNANDITKAVARIQDIMKRLLSRELKPNKTDGVHVREKMIPLGSLTKHFGAGKKREFNEAIEYLKITGVISSGEIQTNNSRKPKITVFKFNS